MVEYSSAEQNHYGSKRPSNFEQFLAKLQDYTFFKDIFFSKRFFQTLFTLPSPALMLLLFSSKQRYLAPDH